MVHKPGASGDEVVSSPTYLTEVQDEIHIGEDFGIDPSQKFALDEDEDLEAADDPVLNKIKVKISRSLEKAETASTVSSEESQEETSPVVSENFTTISYGLQPRLTYEHGKKNTDIMGCKSFCRIFDVVKVIKMKT